MNSTLELKKLANSFKHKIMFVIVGQGDIAIQK